MSYRHDRRRKLIRRWKREGWTQIGWSEGNPVFTAKVGTLPSVAAMEYARRVLSRAEGGEEATYPCEDHVHPGEGK